jgi:hypothetical protein
MPYVNEDFQVYFGSVGEGEEGIDASPWEMQALPPAALCMERQESHGRVHIVNTINCAGRSSSDIFSANQGNQLFEEEDVYRSVGALTMGTSSSLPLLPGCNELEQRSILPAFTLDLDSKHGSGKVNSARPQCLLENVKHSILAPVHAFSTMDDATKLLDRVKSGLAQSKVIHRAFSELSSSFACKLGSAKFDLYVFELAPEDKRAGMGNFVIEIQRISGCTCLKEWSRFIQNFMESVGDICNSKGYFAHDTRAALCEIDRDDFVLFEENEQDDDQVAPTLTDAELEAEYKNMVSMLCNKSTPFEAKLELSRLLAQLSAKKEGARIMLRIKALDALTLALQEELLQGSTAGDFNCSLCSILGNLASLNTCSERSNIGAFTTTAVLRNGSTDELDVEQLRQAARALAGFCKHLHRKSELKNMIRETLEHRRQTCKDPEVGKYSLQVLRNLQAY